MEDNKPIVVIVGASFSGITAMSCLFPFVQIILIDPKDYFEYSPGILVCLANGARLNRIISPLSQFFQKSHGKFIHGSFISLSLKSKTILVEKVGGELASFRYDALLFCCGVPYSPPIRSKTVTIAQRKDEVLLFARKLKQQKIIAILGGGLIGVELAGELCSLHADSSISKIIIFTSEDHLLPTLPMSARTKAQKWLTKSGVDIIFRAKIERITLDPIKQNFYTLTTSSGDSYVVDYVMNCTGNTSLLPQEPSSISTNIDNQNNLKASSLDSDEGVIPLSSMKTKRGTIAVDSTFKPVEGPLATMEGIFVCGDLADIWTTTASSPTPPTSSRSFLAFPLPQWALQLGKEIKSGFIAEVQGEIVAKNILLYCQSLRRDNPATSPLPLLSSQYHHFPRSKFFTTTFPLISCVTLGPTNGILIFNDIVIGGEHRGLVGYLCSRMKLIIEISKIAELKQQLWARLFWRLAGSVVTVCHLLWTGYVSLRHQFKYFDT